MDESQVLQLWRSYDDKIEKALSLHVRSYQEIQKMKASKALGPLRMTRWTGIVVGIVWVILIGFLVKNALSVSAYFFVVSAIIHLVVTGIAVGVYIRHLVLIDEFDNSQTILEAQQKLIALSDSNLRIMGILCLQLPVFSTFYINHEWINTAPLGFWFIHVPLVIIQAGLGVWLFLNLNTRNVHKKWFKKFVHKGEFARIQKAMELLTEAEEV